MKKKMVKLILTRDIDVGQKETASNVPEEFV